MRVHIIGIKGNMGRRYEAILKMLGHKVTGEDIGLVNGGDNGNAQAFIIATPTDTHAAVLKKLAHRGKPVLCEKPLTKDLGELEGLLKLCDEAGTKLQMVSQYDYLIDDIGDGPTLYNYFKSGTDGIYWDTINILKHARGSVAVRNDSPIWQCWINGQKLNLGLMDQAYVEMIADWLINPDRRDFDGIWAAHKKAHDLEAAACLMS